MLPFSSWANNTRTIRVLALIVCTSTVVQSLQWLKIFIMYFYYMCNWNFRFNILTSMHLHHIFKLALVSIECSGYYTYRISLWLYSLVSLCVQCAVASFVLCQCVLNWMMMGVGGGEYFLVNWCLFFYE